MFFYRHDWAHSVIVQHFTNSDCLTLTRQKHPWPTSLKTLSQYTSSNIEKCLTWLVVKHIEFLTTQTSPSSIKGQIDDSFERRHSWVSWLYPHPRVLRTLKELYFTVCVCIHPALISGPVSMPLLIINTSQHDAASTMLHHRGDTSQMTSCARCLSNIPIGLLSLWKKTIHYSYKQYLRFILWCNDFQCREKQNCYWPWTLSFL